MEGGEKGDVESGGWGGGCRGQLGWVCKSVVGGGGGGGDIGTEGLFLVRRKEGEGRGRSGEGERRGGGGRRRG